MTAATLYTWKGSPSTGRKEPIGEVRLDADGQAVWDASLDAYFNPMPLDPRTSPRQVLDPARGHDFIQAMPYVFKAAPYTWAEVEATIPPRPDVTPHGYRITALGLQAEAWADIYGTGTDGEAR